MELNLFETDDQIEKKFNSLGTFNDVADLLEVPKEVLFRILIKNKKKNYSQFNLDKKSGGKRTIYSPVKNLAIIQKKLAYILNLMYSPHKNAHGFVNGLSTISNARPHINQKHVLNFDLKDFFPSISFARVRAMFLYYFKFNPDVSTTLANICCHHEGFLPQGAATSPIISNIISYKLDRNLTNLVARYNCKYTRYADDITISTSRNFFPKEIAIKDEDEKKVYLSKKITSIIEKNGFSVNENKTRLRNKYQRMEVTGLTVNDKLNVNRRFIRYIRVILHAAEKGKEQGQLEESKKVFNQKYSFRQKKQDNKSDMFSVLRGMISYVGQVKGKDDELFLKLRERYNKLVQGLDVPFITVYSDVYKSNIRNTYVIESLYYKYKFEDFTGEILNYQGSAFLLTGVGIVTNAHVVSDFIKEIENGADVDKIKLHQSQHTPNTGSTYAEVLYYNTYLDIAILKADNLTMENEGFDYDLNIKSDIDITLLGYPNYVGGMPLSSRKGRVINERRGLPDKEGSQKLYEISETIFDGNSGGPVVNNSNKVVGVAVKGGENHPNEVIPIEDVLYVFNKKMREASYTFLRTN
ncbi:reverse transcriptase domain-containing protein [Alkalibacillus salilacus]|uniref:RNA-directed DNA polymerase n=1 Tax=Alkalibacillus salilacus TaxID=284582 RepID=A0ABT9VIS6_9BACI|nr:reverse transcriptase domain-containing protein [Alkalibacillus salilacus]MDQ0160869.1 hypothetical protein [Alkalibacillus salilacus]